MYGLYHCFFLNIFSMITSIIFLFYSYLLFIDSLSSPLKPIFPYIVSSFILMYALEKKPEKSKL